jgi:hypothetical protein
MSPAGVEYGFPRQTRGWQNVTKSVMPEGERENWLELCSKISMEHDPVRLAKLIEELLRELSGNNLLTEREQIPQPLIPRINESEGL